MAETRPEDNYLILSTTDPGYTYNVKNIAIREDVYTMEEIDAIVDQFTRELKSMIDDTIILSNAGLVPNAERTSLWMEITQEDQVSEFNDWYQHNAGIND